MNRLRAIVCVVLYAASGPALAQSLIDEDFKTEGLQPRSWCFCQIDPRSPVTFPLDPADQGDRIARIPVDDFSLGGNECRADAPHYECGRPEAFLAAGILGLGEALRLEPELPEQLGPVPFTAPMTQFAPAARTACDDQTELRAHRKREEDECIQRQELRFQNFKHLSKDAHNYSFQLRMPRDEELGEDLQNIRWVIAQWKQEPLSDNYHTTLGSDWGPSPFLALRFNGGLLNVTVQDEHCRCMVAAAAPLSPVGGWRKDPPAGCVLTLEGAGHSQSCEPGFRLEFADEPVLPNPRGYWVEMKFRVQAQQSPAAVIEITANGRTVVKVVGRIGYAPVLTSRTKFKIGHYRDYIADPHYIEVDWLKVDVAR